MMCLRGMIKCEASKNLMNHFRTKHVIDKSKVPVINEKDLEEHFIKGSGPGGQKINKTSSCVHLLHKPSGIWIKCQEDRNRERNRKLAREKLINKLDNLYNGEDSVENQKKRIEKKKSTDRKRKQRISLELKQICQKLKELKEEDA